MFNISITHLIFKSFYEACKSGSTQDVHEFLNDRDTFDQLHKRQALDEGLIMACAHGQLDVVRVLLETNPGHSGKDSLHGAVADVHAMDAYQWTPLFAATFNRQLDVVRYLCTAPALLDREKGHPGHGVAHPHAMGIHWEMAKQGSKPMIEWILTDPQWRRVAQEVHRLDDSCFKQWAAEIYVELARYHRVEAMSWLVLTFKFDADHPAVAKSRQMHTWIDDLWLQREAQERAQMDFEALNATLIDAPPTSRRHKRL